MKLKRLLCLLLALCMLVGVFASCGGDEPPEKDNKPPQSNTGGNNNGGSGNGGNGGGTTPGGGEGTTTEKYPWQNRIYRFSEERFTEAPGEKAGIVAYLVGLGAIAPDETDEAKIGEVLNTLGYAYRNQVQFIGANTVRLLSDDYIYEANYLYKFDTYKNLMLYDVGDTQMTSKLTLPAYTLSLDGKTLTLKVPYSYVTVDGEGDPTTVSCKSYSTLTFTRDEAVKLDAVPNVENKSYALANYALRFADDAAREAFELDQSMTADTWLAQKNATITESNSGVLRVETGNKLVLEKIVGSGISIHELSYYISIGAGGAVTLYNTEKGRDEQDENDVVTALSVSFAADGKSAVVSEGTDVQELRVYSFDKEIGGESVPVVSGKAYKLSEYTFRFASDSDRVALESERGKTLDAIIAELNATITEKHYKTLVVTDNGKVICETVTESGSTVSEFTYFATTHEDGKMTLYKTAAGRDNADESDLVVGVVITVKASGIEVATPALTGSESVQIEVFAFDKELEESSADVLGNSYLLGDYNYRFDSAEALSAFEAEKGKTVTQVLAEERAELASSYGKRLTVAKNYSVKLYLNLASNVNAVALRGYADIADDGTVTLYKTAEGRDSKDTNDLVNTDIVIKVTSSGIELAYPITGGWHIEIYAFDEVLPVYNGIPTVAGTSFESVGSEIRYMNTIEKQRLDQEGMTSEVIFSQISGKRTVYLDSYGRIFCVKTVSGVDTVEWLYYFAVNEDGSITRYKTENGRDNALASDIVKDGMYFSVSPDGRKLEFLQEAAPGYATLAVVHLNFKENVQEDAPKLTEKVYLSGASTPLIWVFDENGVLTAFQNNAILYTYYAKLIAGKVSFYTDPDARDMGDENYLVSSLSADLLLNGSVLLLSNGTTLHYNDAYTKAKTPALSFGSNVKTEYVEANNLNIDLSGNITTNSDGAKIFQWFEGKGMYKTPITSVPKTEGEYTLRVTTVPTANYKTAVVEIVITVITYDELVYGATTVSEPPTGSAIRSKTVDVKTGETYVLHVSGCDDYYENKSECITIYLRNLSAPTSFRLFRETNGVIEEFEAYLDSDEKVLYKVNGVDTLLAITQSDTSSYYIVWTASEDQTVTVRYDRIGLM